MRKKWIPLVIMILGLAGCAHHQRISPAPKIHDLPAHVVQQKRIVPFFSEVTVLGRMNVSLHTGYKKPALIFKGDPRDLEQIIITVRNQGLYLTLGEGYPQHGPVSITIQARTLDKFYYKGSGFISGDKLNTRFLDLYLENEGTTRLGGSLGLQELIVKGNGLVQLNGIFSNHLQVKLIGSPKVQLNGKVKLAKLSMADNATLSLYWLNSDNLEIRAKEKAKMQLAGVVHRLDVELWGAAQFKGRYLRAERSFVKTHDRAVAEIASVHHQSSLASDISDIYYYNVPDTRADFMAFDGSVLDMRDLSSSFLDEEYTRYNKQFP